MGSLACDQVRETIERNIGRVCLIDDGKPVEWHDDWVCKVGIDYKAITDELNEMLDKSKREKQLEDLAWDMWCEIITCPDYRMSPCMTDSICERVRKLLYRMSPCMTDSVCERVRKLLDERSIG